MALDKNLKIHFFRGGVTVLFTGTSLNSTLNPKLVVFENQVEYIGVSIPDVVANVAV